MLILLYLWSFHTLLGFLVSTRSISSLIICGGGETGKKIFTESFNKILKDLLC